MPLDSVNGFGIRIDLSENGLKAGVAFLKKMRVVGFCHETLGWRNETVTDATMLVPARAVAWAKDPVPPGDDRFTVGGEIADRTVRAKIEQESCLIERTVDTGHGVQLGLTKNHKYGSIDMFPSAPIEIKHKQHTEIQVDGALYESKAHGLKCRKFQSDEYSDVFSIVNDGNIVAATQNCPAMIVFLKKTGALVVSLTGTKKPIDSARSATPTRSKADSRMMTSPAFGVDFSRSFCGLRVRQGRGQQKGGFAIAYGNWKSARAGILPCNIGSDP